MWQLEAESLCGAWLALASPGPRCPDSSVLYAVGVGCPLAQQTREPDSTAPAWAPACHARIGRVTAEVPFTPPAPACASFGPPGVCVYWLYLHGPRLGDEGLFPGQLVRD